MKEQDVAEYGTLPETDDLLVFRAAAGSGGVNGAARALALPKSTVSRRLTRLEATLGIRLFHRTGARLTLTDDGARLLERARGILEELGLLMADATGASSKVRGRLRVSAPLDLAGHAVWLALIKRYPEVAFEVELTNRYVDVVREGYDLALRAGRGEDESLVVRRVGSYALFAVASPRYTRRHGRLAHPRELRVHTCLLLSPFRRKSGEAGPATPHRHIVIDDPAVVRAGALEGLGIAILPRSAIDGDLAAGRLVTVLDAYAPLNVPLFAAYPDRKLLPATLRACIQQLVETFGGSDQAE